jgi:uncharacterized cupin superfamily protein
MKPEGTSGTRLHPSNTEFFAMILGGSVILELTDGPHILLPGDAVTIPAGTPHRWENNGTDDVQLLKVTSR